MKLIGDIHANLKLKPLLTPNSIQLGDLDLYDYNKWSFTDNLPRYFIDGNHDNHSLLKHNANKPQKVVPGLHYLPRGLVKNKVMFIGGAHSPDKSSRTPGYSWYFEEQLSYRQFDRIMNITKPVDVIIAHDCPAFVVQQMFHLDSFGQTHRLNLNSIFDKFKPSLWIFGHHHQFVDTKIRDCRFICLGIGQTHEVDIDIQF